jgi:hypothetical protein
MVRRLFATIFVCIHRGIPRCLLAYYGAAPGCRERRAAEDASSCARLGSNATDPAAPAHEAGCGRAAAPLEAEGMRNHRARTPRTSLRPRPSSRASLATSSLRWAARSTPRFFISRSARTPRLRRSGCSTRCALTRWSSRASGSLRSSLVQIVAAAAGRGPRRVRSPASACSPSWRTIPGRGGSTIRIAPHLFIGSVSITMKDGGGED